MPQFQARQGNIFSRSTNNARQKPKRRLGDSQPLFIPYTGLESSPGRDGSGTDNVVDLNSKIKYLRTYHTVQPRMDRRGTCIWYSVLESWPPSLPSGFQWVSLEDRRFQGLAN